ncbi:nucleotide exchange factor GrpE [Candidatus Saccharibacteria bacterium]|nr:nucleotide exchange factor GrpE [Candidatus Saccharibacteria bacterium]MCL1962722.1 nucleotide exchange factor GrpE [Candidatus Saccharibacteria bacterium]
MTKPKKPDELEQQIGELTADLQRVRADFENYRKRVDSDLERAKSIGENKAVMKILPLIDILAKAMADIPMEISENTWVLGIVGVQKNLEKMMGEINLQPINVKLGDDFNPDLHHAVQFDEQSGEREIIAEILQNGYIYQGQILRPAMVKVTRK